MRLNPFRRSRAGEPYEGPVVRVGVASPELAKWPGVYAVKDGKPDPKVPLKRNAAKTGWERVR